MNDETLRDYAEALNAQGVEGVELSCRLEARALVYYAGFPGLSSQQRFDGAMRDLAAVLLGTYALQVLQLAKRLPGKRDPLVDQFIGMFQGLDLSQTGARGKGASGNSLCIDPAHAAGFKPGFSDGTDNQIAHAFTYAFLAYVTNSRIVTTAGDFKHEMLDNGSSTQDYDLGAWGIELGLQARKLRDHGAGPKDKDAFPALWGAALSRHGQDFGDPASEWNQGSDYRALAVRESRLAQTDLHNPSGDVFLGMVNANADLAITAMEALRRIPVFNSLVEAVGKKLGTVS